MVVPVRSLSNLSGLMLSVACVMHCILMPVCLASLPGWGLAWLASSHLHQVLALLGVAIGLWTLLPGWRLHRRNAVLLLAGGGLCVMNYAAFLGGDCCAATAKEGTSDHLPACCKDSCCVALAADRSESNAVSLVGGNSFASLTAVRDWLWHHPTALGAALLAWAHCFNGVCGRACCLNRSAARMSV